MTNPTAPTIAEWKDALSGKDWYSKHTVPVIERQIAYLQSAPTQKVTGELREAVEKLVDTALRAAQLIDDPETLVVPHGNTSSWLKRDATAVRASLAKCETTRELTDEMVEAVKRLEIEARGVLVFRDEIGHTNANILDKRCAAVRSAFASVLTPPPVKDAPKTVREKIDTHFWRPAPGEEWKGNNSNSIIEAIKELATVIDALKEGKP